MRKIIIAFLIGAVSLLGIVPVLAQEIKYSVYNLKDYEKISGKTLKFNEAPELKVKVAAGEIPPVEERLPEEPLVVKPVEEIGRYGGVWRTSHLGSADLSGPHYFLDEPLMCWNREYNKIQPNIVKDWEVSEDAKTFTFYLRKGMKWSDGAPFTVNDFLFYWNDIALNKEISPVVSSKLAIAGEPGKIEKINDYAFKISFTKPYGIFMEFLADRGAPIIYAPKHYLKQFHPKYTSEDELKQTMENEGFTYWTDLFSGKNTPYDNPELPGIWAWYPLQSCDKPIQMFMRNPYYWKVDIEGNQLPYIDKKERTLVSDVETIVLKNIAGDVDYYNRRIEGIPNYPICMQNQEKGGYRVQLSVGPQEVRCTIFLNFFHKDPVTRKLFRDKRFRIALSEAINREEISQLVLKGVAKPAQPSPGPGTVWYEEKFEKHHMYNLEHSNQLLDEIGLKWDKNHEFRLRPDGKRLRFVIEVAPDVVAAAIDQIGLVKEHWKKIGIQTVVKPVARELCFTRVPACEHEIVAYRTGWGYPGDPPVMRPNLFFNTQTSWAAPKWGLWYATGGKSGEEPPEDVKRIMQIHDEVLREPSTEKRVKLIKEALAIHAKNLWVIGIVREAPQSRFYIINKDLGNVPKMIISSGPKGTVVEQLFFKK